jgi:hypothetical protein
MCLNFKQLSFAQRQFLQLNDCFVQSLKLLATISRKKGFQKKGMVSKNTD